MRCPKCGYISFDHLEVCVKCKKDIKAVSDGLNGSVFQVKAPTFLQFQPRQGENENAAGNVFEAKLGAGEDYIDDDLEILIEDDPETGKDTEIEFTEKNLKNELRLESMGATEDDEEEGEIEIDFSQFEDTPDDELTADQDKEERVFAMEMPAGLADISDLAPPSKMAGGAESEISPISLEKPAGDDFDMDDFDFDLGFDDLDNEAPAPPSPTETMLSLEDIDFTETLIQSTAKTPNNPGTTDMDEELNFDLDLGGLSIHKDQ